MTVAEYKELLELAKDRKNWKPELFKKYQVACVEMMPCVFNELRKVLTKEEYNAFDLEYCEYLRPGTKEGVKYIEKLHRKEAAEQWEQKQTKRRVYKSNPKSNFLIISKELGFQLENKE